MEIVLVILAVIALVSFDIYRRLKAPRPKIEEVVISEPEKQFAADSPEALATELRMLRKEMAQKNQKLDSIKWMLFGIAGLIAVIIFFGVKLN
jgi:cytochrome c-type biogenesis protein CcmH/NrfG